jgi:methyl-accepting chemotaxis protein
MVNPLALPLAVMETVVELPRTLVEVRRSFARAVEIGERLDAQVEVIVATGDRLVEAAGRAEQFADKLVAGGDKLVTAADRSEETADKLLTSAEALVEVARAAREEARAAVAAIEATRPIAESLRDMGEPLLGSSNGAREELERATKELAHANAQVARIIEMSGPFERVVNRLRRD